MWSVEMHCLFRVDSSISASVRVLQNDNPDVTFGHFDAGCCVKHAVVVTAREDGDHFALGMEPVSLLLALVGSDQIRQLILLQEFIHRFLRVIFTGVARPVEDELSGLLFQLLLPQGREGGHRLDRVVPQQLVCRSAVTARGDQRFRDVFDLFQTGVTAWDSTVTAEDGSVDEQRQR